MQLWRPFQSSYHTKLCELSFRFVNLSGGLEEWGKKRICFDSVAFWEMSVFFMGMN